MTIPHLIFNEAVLRRVEAIVERHPELRAVMSSPEAMTFVRDRCTSSIAGFAAACEIHADRVCFASSTGTITYGRLWERVVSLATGWARQGLVTRGDRVGICGGPGVDWVVADLACLYSGAVSAPLAVNLPPSELRALIEHAELTTIVSGVAQLPQLARVLAESRGCRTVIVMRNSAEDRDGDPVNAGFGPLPSHPRLVDISELEVVGTAGARSSFVELGPDELVTLMYTSGSTSRPKGVMLTERRSRATLLAALDFPLFPYVMIGYLPHSSVAGRRLVFDGMMHGGITHFASQSLPFADMHVARPTLMPFLPRVSGMIYQQFQSELVARFGADIDPAAAIDDARGQLVMDEMRSTVLGDRLCLIRLGAANTPPDIVTFLERCFGVPVVNGYGATETGSITSNGTIFPHIDYKLVDVPELGYSTQDRPFPRGELLVRSVEITAGYLNDPAGTAELFDPEGYVKTGDVVEERENRQLVWIDRRSSVTKLAQGQFIATTRIEGMYAAGSAFIEQIFLYANPRHAFLLAVIVPSADLIRARGDGGDEQIRRILREEIDRIARATGRRSHEVPRDFLIEVEPFTQANELLTESGKQSTRRLRERYAGRLDELHATIEARQLSATHLITDAQTSTTVRLRAMLAIALGLGVEDIEAAPPGIGFVGYGGDSISALRFCTMVGETCGVTFPVGSVLDPSASLSTIVERVTDLLGRERATLSFDDVHGRNVDVVSASDLDRIVPKPDQLGAASAAAGPPSVVLLTGASGFLGQFLVLELAQRVPSGGQVICVVRGNSDRTAHDRMRNAFAASGGDLGARFDQLVAEERVLVRAGDLIAPQLGLPASEYEALCDRVDAVVHNGALVNHAMSYQHLFEPNVLGTLEVMRLAMRRRAAINFVSSIGVASRPQPAAPVSETELARELWPTRSVGGGPTDHGVGYVTSKWAGEVLLERLHQQLGIAVNIFRCSNIAPHRDYLGHLNWADNTNRLLYSVLTTRLAPQSFYAPGSQPARYDLLPLDAVAAAIAAIASVRAAAFSTYHLSSAQLQPAVSLDTLVDWIESAGIRLTRLPHAAWFAAFRDQLEQLPAPSGPRSALATISRWRAPFPPERGAHVDTAAYREATRRLLGDNVPTVDESLVHRWIRALAD